MKTVGFTTFLASSSIRKPLVKNVLQTGFVIGKPLVVLLNRVFIVHAQTLAAGVGQGVSNPSDT